MKQIKELSELKPNNFYFLKTLSEDGFDEPEELWIKALFTMSGSLIDEDGDYWSEWLAPFNGEYDIYYKD